MSAPDVGDQGPAANPNESVPQPWMPDQTQAALTGNAGTQFGQGQQPQAAAPAPSAPQPAASSNDDVMRTLRQLMGEVAALAQTAHAPRKIVVERNAKGQITGARAA